MIRFSQFITEAKYHKIFEKILDDDIEFLLYLVHDKSHVMDNTRPIPNMERVLKLTKRLAILPRLYRGLHTKDIEVFKKHMEDEEEYFPDRYQSFSEDLKVAQKFSKGIIYTSNDNHAGFPYSDFLEWYYTNLKQTDPEEYEDQDGDGILKDNEKEWIFPMDNYYRIEKITKKGKFWMVDGTNRN